jgi:stage V sporulation protein D (sporulation-specific penicillin-binding protein)
VISEFSSIINGGAYYQPLVVKKITDDKNNTISDINGTLLKQTVSKKTSDMLKQYMYATVSQGGTGKDAKVDGYTMGGKTGTAQKLPRGQGNYLVSFIGYAPADKPQVAIYVVVDEPNAVDEAHSQFAQGIVKSILTEILPYMNIYPDEANPANTPAAAPDGPADAPADLPADTDATKAQNQKDNTINAPVTNPDAAQ